MTPAGDRPISEGSASEVQAGRRVVLASGSPQRREILGKLGIEFEVVVPGVEELTGGDPEVEVLENARRKARAVAAQLGLPTRDASRPDTGADREGGEGGVPRTETPPAGAPPSPPPTEPPVGETPPPSPPSELPPSEPRSSQPPEQWVIACDTDVVLDGRALGKPADAAEAREYLDRMSGRAHAVMSGLVVIAGGEERSGLERTTVVFKRLSEAEKERYVRFGEWRGRSGGYAIQTLGSTLVERLEGSVSNVVGLPVGLLADLAPELLDLP